MRRPLWLIALVAFALPLEPEVHPAGASGPATLTVRIAGGATKTALHLQPGFATVLRADHRIDTVAIGDPRIVMATTVKRGQDVYDLVLQPQTSTGVTNMVVWLGEVTSIWDLMVGSARRTADIVYVVTAPQAAASSHSVPAAPALPATHAGTPSQPAANTPAAPSPQGQAPEPPVPPEAAGVLQSEQEVGNVSGSFQLARVTGGIRIRYRITNKSSTDLNIRPTGILVKVDGRLMPFGLAREGADKGRPTILPSGTTETGMISSPVRAPRQVELIFSLFPVETGKPRSAADLPLTFQAMFTEVQQLPSSTP
jgi:putative type II/III system pilus formation protein